MPDTDIPDAPAPAPEPAPVAPPATKALYLAVKSVFDQHAGAVWSLTPAQAAEGGDALRPMPTDEVERKFILAAWGRAPLVRD